MAEGKPEVIVLDVAALPREQIGPFLLLGVDKDAANAEVEAHWAQRLIWARAKQIRVPLEDVNWAKEVLLDRDKRIPADVQSLNPDIINGEMRQLLEKHGPLEPEAPTWEPQEAALPEIPPAALGLIPDLEAVCAKITAPDVPMHLPAVARILDELAAATIDPWE